MPELQLAQFQGKLLDAADGERVWSEAVVRMRNAMLAVPSRCCTRFPDPRAAEGIIRAEIEAALKQIAGKA